MHDLRYTRRKLAKIDSVLHNYYGTPDLGNLPDPEDEIFFIVLTRQTHPPNVLRPWISLRRRYPHWEDLYNVKPATLARLIKSGGLSTQKSDSIITNVRYLVDRFGKVTLQPLSALSDKDLEAELLKLKGLNLKSVRCVMMYSMGRDVFPVDTHCFRTLDRLLGFPNDWDISKRSTHDEIQRLVPKRSRFSLHVNLVCLGRDLCRVPLPRCSRCPLTKSCTYSKAA